ncbi:DNA mismatch repair endonuclease MutL [Fictibacillus enclensis]|uniref:DNA mismatch repair endonuclease MutL n=1 Tax=Fictibacillus enclensis TaxID=1017270 RepID=UPI0025A1314E|nr:DNA mismatch repair endonuclease MutL [Fictibacillus enclensis]MDM5198949.1 DNA mismatch repair endonuclease MutL [Fictibacillus enclensis]
MGKIIQLDDHLSNKIAAGEVVERPASVVKELVENSIDAHSTRIEIELEEGGLSLIRIIDNGDGIEPEDCKLAFSRHATSKIKEEQDLFQIRTMGFRGEALPSIASVSHMEMSTGTGNGPGTTLVLVNGEVQSLSSTNARKGTDITVRHLFYNTPARLKHMKTINTELGNISDVINRLAMGHPEISFRLRHNGRDILNTNGNGNVLNVIAAVYGMNVARNMVPVSAKSLDYEINGYIAKPEITRASRNYVSLFMNGRYIKNYNVQRAIQQAYHTLLPIGRHPVVSLSITMDPSIIDVNVHPSKLEARLSKEPELTGLIEEEVRNVLRSLRLIPEPVRNERKPQKDYSEQGSFSFEHRLSSPENTNTITITEEADAPEKAQVWNGTAKLQEEPAGFSPVQPATIPAFGSISKVEKASEADILEEPFIQEEAPSFEPEPDVKPKEQPEEKNEKIPVMYPIGQMHGTYIIAQNEEGMYLIDQHAAQERIKYEFFREKVGQVASELQELMIPLTFQFTSKEALTINDNLEALEQVGVFLEPFGSGTFIVKAHPQWFPSGYERESIEDLIGQVLKDKKADIKKLREKAAIMMSCKGSIKANHHLRNDEIFSLLETLRKSEDPYTCPHGRPIIVHFSTYEMEKMFKRVM